MLPGKDYSSVFVTAPNLTLARKIANAVLKARLAACANLIPKIESHYWWQGQLESAAEVLIIFKTAKKKLEELEQCVLKNHTYETPEIIEVHLDSGNGKYLEWIGESLEGK
jgi:periplasmic divalent cation tolerance protein